MARKASVAVGACVYLFRASLVFKIFILALHSGTQLGMVDYEVRGTALGLSQVVQAGAVKVKSSGRNASTLCVHGQFNLDRRSDGQGADCRSVGKPCSS